MSALNACLTIAANILYHRAVATKTTSSQLTSGLSLIFSVTALLCFLLIAKHYPADQTPASRAANTMYAHRTIMLTNTTLDLMQRTGNEHVIYQLHGGSFRGGITESHQKMGRTLTRLTGYDNALIDYRLMPQHPYPAGLNDVIDGYMSLLSSGYSPGNIVVVGDSAGGNLALALAMKLRDTHVSLPGGIVLMSPFTDMRGRGASYESNMYADPTLGEAVQNRPSPDVSPILDPGQIADNLLDDKYLSVNNNTYSGLPPLYVQVGSTEVLLSDSQDVVQKTKDAGGTATLKVYDNTPHGFQLNDTAEAAQALKDVSDFIHSISHN